MPKSYLLISFACMGLAALLWTVRCLAVAMKSLQDLEHCRFGLRGEQAVAEALTSPKTAIAGYVAFHDVPGDGAWNIDHVVIGPAGVFVLETKACSRRKATRKQEEHEVFFDGQTLQFPWRVDHDAAKQVQRNAEWTRQFVAPFAPKDLIVESILVVPGWFVKTLGKYPIKAMNAKYLADYFAGLPRKFTRDQLRPVRHRLDERCRTLEF
jgi:hypothetical protein